MQQPYCLMDLFAHSLLYNNLEYYLCALKTPSDNVIMLASAFKYILKNSIGKWQSIIYPDIYYFCRSSLLLFQVSFWYHFLWETAFNSSFRPGL